MHTSNPLFVIFALMLSLLVPVAVAQTTAEAERVLIPIYLPADQAAPGAYGSTWQTELVVRNEGESPSRVFQNLCTYECRPPIPSTACAKGAPIPPQQQFAGNVTPDDSGVNPAVFLHIDKATQVAMNLRLFERSRGTVETGVEIPIVRDDDLVTGTSWLVNVPNRPESTRVHLRVYFVSAPDRDAAVRVRLFPGDSTLATTDLVLRAIGSSDAAGVPPPGHQPCVGTPAYAIELLTPFLHGQSDSVRVRIDSLTPALQYWPMISITTNETQYVTLVTPQ